MRNEILEGPWYYHLFQHAIQLSMCVRMQMCSHHSSQHASPISYLPGHDALCFCESN
jgi:NAD(P)H-nitrite reductase large subunit